MDETVDSIRIKDILNNKKFSNKHILLLILQNILGLSKEEIYLKRDLKINNFQLKEVKKNYDLYTKNYVPIEYILGYSEFMREKFYVNKNVLIPRPETEYLIKYALDDLKKFNKKDTLVLDIGTGSGIIAVMLAKLSGYKVLGIDISIDALKVANINKIRLVSTNNINFAQSNLLENIEIDSNKDLIICANLPYVEENYKLDKLTEKEPEIAIFAGKDGLLLYRQLLRQIRQLNNKNIYCYFELTYKQAKILNEEFNLNGEILPTCHNNIKILRTKTPHDKPMT